MKTVILSLLAAFTLSFCQSQKVVDLEVTEFKEAIIESEGLIILDVRTPEEWSEGIIENAITIDFYGSGFKAELEKLDPSKSVYVYCRSGGRSAKAGTMLSDLGFNSVHNLLGGITAWKKAGFNTVTP